MKVIKSLVEPQNTTSGYVRGCHVTMVNIIKLYWLPIKEHTEINTIKVVL